MADSTEPDADGTPAADAPADPVAADAATEPVRSTRRARRGLDRRTVAIAAVLGIAAALFTVLVATAFTSGGGSDEEPTMRLQDPEALLKLPLEAEDGETTDLNGFREDGKATLVNFWQAACVPCVEEMPMLDAAQADNPDVTFVGVNVQESAEKADRMARATGITFPWAIDLDGQLWYDAGGKLMPTTVLLDPSGAIITTKSGAFDDAEELQTFLDQAG